MAGRSSLQESPVESRPGGDQSDRLRDVVSLRWLLLGGALLVGPAVIVSSVVPVVGGPVGVFVGAFTVGALGVARGYVLAGGVGVLLGVLAAAVDPRLLYLAESTRLVQLAVVGAVGGLLISLLGVYFGRDLRSGLTQDLE